MIKWMKKQNGIASLFMGIGTVFTGYFAWGLLTIFHKSGSFGTAGFLFSVLTMFFYALFCCVVSLEERREMNRQIMVISGLGFLISLLLLLRGGTVLFSQREYKKLLMNILWLADFAGCYFYLGNKMRQDIDDMDKKSSYGLCFSGGIRIVWNEQKWFYILLVLTLFFLIEPDALQFKWDGLLYYFGCQDISIDSLSTMALYGHIAQTYGMLNGLGILLIGNTAIAMISINILLFLCSICAFYGIMRCVLPGKQDFVYALVTAVYAWSPFTLGMVFYHNLDFYCQCFFVIMLYFLYRKEWIYFFAASMLFCFTKEPAILIYAAVCASVVILDFIGQAGVNLGKRMGKLLHTKRYYFMVLPGILWLVTYMILGPWSAGEGGFRVDLAYALEKLKVLYIFQFNWLFTLLCLCGMVSCIAGKRKGVWRCLFPVLCGQAAFTVFSCVFSTVNHPRYNGTNQPALYCMAILLTACLLEHLYGRIIIGGVVVLMAVSSFYTIDPITLLCFSRYNIGDTAMVTTSTIPLGDGMIYNRQMLWLEHALGMALEDTLMESDVVLFPALGSSTYYFDGMAETDLVDNDGRLVQEYWYKDANRRGVIRGDSAQAFIVWQLPEKSDWNSLAKKSDGRYNYCYLSCAGVQCAERIRERFHVLEEKEYAYRGWRIHRICFE